MIVNQATVRKIYETGQGGIKVQGEWKVEKVAKKKKDPKDSGRASKQIVIRSIPYGVNKGNLLANMGEIIATRKLTLVTDLVDESSLDNGMRIVMDLKEGADPEAVMAYLFKHTSLQDNFSCNFTCLVPTDSEGDQDDIQPKRLGFKELLVQFLDFRLETIRRRYQFLLEQLLKRLHILEGFKIVFDDLDNALEIIKESEGRLDAASRLRDAYKLDEIQSLAIVDLNLYRIASLEIDKILEEHREKKKEAQRIEKILASEKKLWKEVRKELEAFDKEFGDSRRTKIADEEDVPEFDPEAYIIKENTNVVFTRKGWVKRVGRLSKVSNTRVREGDEVLNVLPGSTTDHVIFLSNDGFAYTTRIDQVPVSSGYGEPISKYFRPRDGISFVGALTTDSRFTPDGILLPPRRKMFFGKSKEWQLLVVTKKGQVLRVSLNPYMTSSTKAGRRYVRLVEGDEVVFIAVPTADHETMFLAASDGHVIHFPIEEANLLSGVGKGVRGIKLSPKSKCIGGYVLGGFKECMRVENTGKKVMEFRRGKYTPTSRAGKGYEAIRRGGLKRILPEPIQLIDWTQIAEPE